MKMTKKLLVAAACSAFAFVFTSCLPDLSLSDLFQTKFGDKKNFTYSDNDKEDGLGKWTIKGTNESETEYIRGMQFLQTKHSDMAGVVEITGSDGGVVGIAFNVSQNTDKTLDNYKTYNFCLAGVRYYKNTLNGDTKPQPYFYVSYYANISAENMTGNNFGAYNPETDKYITKTAYDPECYTPYEIEFQTYKKLDYSLIDSENDTMTVVIDVKEVNKKNDADGAYADGSYLVNLYKIDAYNVKGMKFNSNKDEYLVTSSPVVLEASKLGKDTAAQAKVGVYANVYPKPKTTDTPTTLDAVVRIADLTNSAIAE